MDKDLCGDITLTITPNPRVKGLGSLVRGGVELGLCWD